MPNYASTMPLPLQYAWNFHTMPTMP